MKLGKTGSLKTDLHASISGQELTTFIQRIVATDITSNSLTITHNELIFTAESERALRFKYALEQTDNKICTENYSDWIDIATEVTQPLTENGEFKLCLVGSFGSKEADTTTVYKVTINSPELAPSLLPVGSDSEP